jgi:hypothetical protein
MLMVAPLLVLVATGCSKPPDVSDKKLPVIAQPPSPNKLAFDRARLASTAANWPAATAALESIEIAKVDDIEVIEYVGFSKLCAKTADALGVDRKCNPDSPTDVVANVDWLKVIATVADNAKNPAAVAQLISDAHTVRKGIPRYQELDAQLVRKYGAK